jgi:hypothetical protein
MPSEMHICCFQVEYVSNSTHGSLKEWLTTMQNKKNQKT